ncbi:hypothetical protein WG66_004270 [Moniliophthora roreri]|nr:hypothetical protein WG66_004270 [Moniliophthora roreri]
MISACQSDDTNRLGEDAYAPETTHNFPEGLFVLTGILESLFIEPMEGQDDDNFQSHLRTFAT